jgi:AcrR family transcriptional regulator
VTGDGIQARRGPGRPRGGEATTQATKDAIVAAAYEVFAETGYISASVREIARRCGVSHATLLHHFPHKVELLVAVLDRRDAAFHVDATADPPPVETMFAEMVAQAGTNEAIPGLVRMYTMLAAEAYDETHPAHAYFVRRHETIVAFVARAIAAAQQAGTMTAHGDSRELATAIVSHWDGLQLDAPVNPGLVVADQLRFFL